MSILSRAAPAARAAATVATALLLSGCPAETRRAYDPGDGPRPVRDPSCRPHAVVLVRHAEKAAAEPTEKDPDLSPKGMARAARLATMLGRTSITALVATEYKRTQQTLAPLSAEIGRPVATAPAATTNDLIRHLRDAPPGTTTVVATHSNVLPRIVAELGGGPLSRLDPQGNLPDDEFGRVVVLTLGCSPTAALVELSSD